MMDSLMLQSALRVTDEVDRECGVHKKRVLSQVNSCFCPCRKAAEHFEYRANLLTTAARAL